MHANSLIHIHTLHTLGSCRDRPRVFAKSTKKEQITCHTANRDSHTVTPNSSLLTCMLWFRETSTSEVNKITSAKLACCRATIDPPRYHLFLLLGLTKKTLMISDLMSFHLLKCTGGHKRNRGERDGMFDLHCAESRQ